MGLLDKIDTNKTADSKSGTAAQNPEDFSALRAKIHMEVVEALNKHEDRQGKDMSEADTRALIDSILCQNESLPRTERSRIAQEIYDQIRGLGPLEKLMFDPTVTEIMVNGPKNIFIERKGKIIRTNVVFDDEEQLLNVIDRIVSPLGRHVDEANPMVDARLSDGSRVNAVIPPLSLKGPLLTIRRFSKVPLTVNDLIGFGSLTYKMASFLEACVKGRLNIVISGGTGSGKTTLLNILSSYIPHDERIITIEDAAELQLRQDHVLTLESRPANLEGKG